MESGGVAPAFSLPSLDGKTYSLESLVARGLVAVAFFKISCPVCQFTFPFLERLQDRYAGERGTLVGISQDDLRSTKQFNTEYGITFPTLLDGKGYPVSNAYGITHVPTVFLIGQDARIKVVSQGFDKAGLERMATEFGQLQKLPAVPFFAEQERVPAHRPG